MERSTAGGREDDVSRARRWLVLAKLVATTLAALAAVAKALGWI